MRFRARIGLHRILRQGRPANQPVSINCREMSTTFPRGNSGSILAPSDPSDTIDRYGFLRNCRSSASPHPCQTFLPAIFPGVRCHAPLAIRPRPSPRGDLDGSHADRWFDSVDRPGSRPGGRRQEPIPQSREGGRAGWRHRVAEHVRTDQPARPAGKGCAARLLDLLLHQLHARPAGSGVSRKEVRQRAGRDRRPFGQVRQ